MSLSTNGTLRSARAATATIQPRTVVVGYDGSDEARVAFAVAIDRSQPSDRIVVVHATAPASHWLAPPSYQRAVEQIHQAAERVLDELRPIAEQVETPIEFEVLEGLARRGPHPRRDGARSRRDRCRLPRARPAPRRARQRLPGAAPRGSPPRARHRSRRGRRCSARPPSRASGPRRSRVGRGAFPSRVRHTAHAGPHDSRSRNAFELAPGANRSAT